MEVGGDHYKLLKEQLDAVSKEVADNERNLTRSRTTLGTSDQTLRKIDSDINRLQEEVQVLKRAKEQLNLDCEKNDRAG